jgi:hypothetical protein
MTTEELLDVLKLCEAVENDGWSNIPDGRLLSLHLSVGGVGMAISRINRMRAKGVQFHAGTARDEIYVFRPEDVFAAGIDETSSKGRKAGFV